MNALLTAKEAILAACKPIEADATIIMPTPFTYPDGDPVKIHIMPRTDGNVILHDAGETIRNYVLSGGDPDEVKRSFKSRASRHGFHTDKKLALLTPTISAAATPIWAGFLGQCIVEISEWLSDKHAKDTTISIRKLLDAELERIFCNALERDIHLQGSSGKIHKFHWAIHGKKELVLDAVSPDGNAVYAAFSKHIDLAFDDRPDMISRIAYDPEEHWHPGDLSFLQRAAPLINYRAAPEELMRLAA